MNLNDLKKMQKEEVLVLISKHNSDLIPDLEFSLGKTFIIDDSEQKEICIKIIDIINKSKIKSIIFVNLHEYFRELIPNISINIKVKWLITHPVASFTDPNINAIFINIMEYYDRFLVKNILCLEKGLHEILMKKGYESELINFNNKREQKNFYNPDLSIGILSNDFDPKHGFYNMLTALKLINYNKVKLVSNMKSTIDFLEFYDINYEIHNDVEFVMKNNTVNLYCNFTNSDNALIIKSLDMGIPCVVGNTDIFDDYPSLKEHLVLKRDDDVNEIATKVNYLLKNYRKIMLEYKNMRKIKNEK